MAIYFFAPLIGLFINTMCQILSYKIFFSGKPLSSIVFGFFSGGVVVVFLGRLAIDGLATYLFLSYGYFHFFNLGETARRIRLLRELSEAPGGLTFDEILRHYNADEIVSRRLDRLLKTGQILCRQGRYTIGNPLILFLSRVLVAFKIIFLNRRSEIE